MNKLRYAKGFTLIEVLISVMILAIIATMTAVGVQGSLKRKRKMDRDIAEFGSVRDALAIMTNDLNKAFHWIDVNDFVTQQAADEFYKDKPQLRPPPLPGPTPIPANLVTAFMGGQDKVSFTSLSHVRVNKNAPESDQAEIGYFLKSVKSAETGEQTKAVVRRVSTVLDGDVEQGGKETVLIENVRELRFRYLGGVVDSDNKEWRQEWRSSTNDNSISSGKFPDAVEVTLVMAKGDRTVEVSSVAILEMPNNEPLPTPAPSPAPGTGGATGSGSRLGNQ